MPKYGRRVREECGSQRSHVKSSAQLKNGAVAEKQLELSSKNPIASEHHQSFKPYSTSFHKPPIRKPTVGRDQFSEKEEEEEDESTSITDVQEERVRKWLQDQRLDEQDRGFEREFHSRNPHVSNNTWKENQVTPLESTSKQPTSNTSITPLIARPKFVNPSGRSNLSSSYLPPSTTRIASATASERNYLPSRSDDQTFISTELNNNGDSDHDLFSNTALPDPSRRAAWRYEAPSSISGACRINSDMKRIEETKQECRPSATRFGNFQKTDVLPRRQHFDATSALPAVSGWSERHASTREQPNVPETRKTAPFFTEKRLEMRRMQKQETPGGKCFGISTPCASENTAPWRQKQNSQGGSLFGPISSNSLHNDVGSRPNGNMYEDRNGRIRNRAENEISMPVNPHLTSDACAASLGEKRASDQEPPGASGLKPISFTEAAALGWPVANKAPRDIGSQLDEWLKSPHF
ncbi:unnamed protein product [Gongylonema pulchrum]|uniref:Uncharacterized protein n=1 Tax=Gongylonema pulchrum TaxID=637853 RepID=A0A183DXW1_9BILA|nr:unnamed protein product [Gongylonema pulchrum]